MSRHNFPYMLGVYLGVNAISDAGLVVDGPDCAMFKAEHVFGNHDFQSTLMSASGKSRIAFSQVDTNRIVMDRSDQILETVDSLDRRKQLSAILVAGMPIVTLTGLQHDLILRKADQQFHADVWAMPEENLSHDWNDGYEETMCCLARNMDFPRRPKRKGNVAVVGYFMSRNEPEETANLRELDKIFSALSLNPVSVWLSGTSVDSLREVAAAEAIVSLPPGRKAARILADRLNAELIELDIPFGFGNTERFVTEIAQYFGREKQGRSFLDRELDTYMPRLAWAVPHLFLHKRAFYVGPMFFFDGFMDITRAVGIEVKSAAITSRAAYYRERIMWPCEDPPPVDFEINGESWLFRDGPPPRVVDFIVSDSQMAPGLQLPRVEFGFPSFFHHSFYETPYLGIGGAVAFLGRIAQCIYGINRMKADGK